MAAPTRQSDLTGRQRATLQKQHAEEVAAREEEITLATARGKKEMEETIFDATSPSESPLIIDELEDLAVELETDETVIIRVNEEIVDMTFGAGNFYSFKVGPRYKVTKDLANYLEEIGAVWH